MTRPDNHERKARRFLAAAGERAYEEGVSFDEVQARGRLDDALLALARLRDTLSPGELDDAAAQVMALVQRQYDSS